MGVKGLWSILEEVKQPVILRSLEGQTVAVDLSAWILQAQCLKDNQVPDLHLIIRNIFFKVKQFHIDGIKAVFVTDGDEPVSLKYKTFEKRRVGHSGHTGHTSHTDNLVSDGDKLVSDDDSNRVTFNKRMTRSKHFKETVNQCCELLQYFGYPVIQSCHEAEALCGRLSENGLVDAVITEDGDAILYGATTVYRNLTINSHSSQKCQLDKYEMSDIEEKLELCREQLVCLAAMMGSDYDTGIQGVGEKKGLHLVQKIWREDAIEKFLGLKDDENLLRVENIKRELSQMRKDSHCSRCGHLGNLAMHQKNGCEMCQSMELCSAAGEVCGCDWHCKQSQLTQCKAELDMRVHAMETSGYPEVHRKVIEEFMKSGEECPKESFQWLKPQLDKIQIFMKKYLRWEYGLTSKHIVPCLAAWEIRQRNTERDGSHLIIPHSITATRKRDHQNCYEVKWHKLDVDLASLEEPYYTTLETQEAFQLRFPKMAKEFDEKIQFEKMNRIKGKTALKKRKNNPPSKFRQTTLNYAQKKVRYNTDTKTDDAPDDSDSLSNIVPDGNIPKVEESSSSETVNINPSLRKNDCKKRKQKKASAGQTPLILQFFKNTRETKCQKSKEHNYTGLNPCSSSLFKHTSDSKLLTSISAGSISSEQDVDMSDGGLNQRQDLATSENLNSNNNPIAQMCEKNGSRLEQCTPTLSSLSEEELSGYELEEVSSNEQSPVNKRDGHLCDSDDVGMEVVLLDLVSGSSSS